jgi:hypothetical protein
MNTELLLFIMSALMALNGAITAALLSNVVRLGREVSGLQARVDVILDAMNLRMSRDTPPKGLKR